MGIWDLATRTTCGRIRRSVGLRLSESFGAKRNVVWMGSTGRLSYVASKATLERKMSSFLRVSTLTRWRIRSGRFSRRWSEFPAPEPQWDDLELDLEYVVPWWLIGDDDIGG